MIYILRFLTFFLIAILSASDPVGVETNTKPLWQRIKERYDKIQTVSETLDKFGVDKQKFTKLTTASYLAFKSENSIFQRIGETVLYDEMNLQHPENKRFILFGEKNPSIADQLIVKGAIAMGFKDPNERSYYGLGPKKHPSLHKQIDDWTEPVNTYLRLYAKYHSDSGPFDYMDDVPYLSPNLLPDFLELKGVDIDINKQLFDVEILDVLQAFADFEDNGLFVDLTDDNLNEYVEFQVI